MKDNWPQGCLSDDEWSELVSIEYVLTWKYTDDYEGDFKRYKELLNKKYGDDIK